MAQSLPRFARPWMYLALVALAWLAFALPAAWAPRSDDSVGRYSPRGEESHVVYGGVRYLADTERLRLPDDRMVAIGRTGEGYVVYALRDDTAMAGGGGGGPPPTAPPGDRTPGPAFLKTPDGRFVPLVPDRAR